MSSVPAGSGGAANPSDLEWAPNGNLLVADRFAGGGGRVLEYDALSGAFVGIFVAGGAGSLNQPTHVTFAYLCDPDCNTSANLDAWDIDSGASRDLNNNGLPDECEDCLGDLTGDDRVGLDDLTILLGHFGEDSGAAYTGGDITGDGAVSLIDLTAFLSLFGTVCT